MDIIDRIICSAINKYEEFTHWYWNKKPHRVTCKICGDTMHSSVDRYSPEECGWRNIKGGSSWICHSCDAHRDFKPYTKLVDLDEEIRWFDPNYSKRPIEEIQLERFRILKMLENQYINKGESHANIHNLE